MRTRTPDEDAEVRNSISFLAVRTANLLPPCPTRPSTSCTHRDSMTHSFRNDQIPIYPYPPTTLLQRPTPLHGLPCPPVLSSKPTGAADTCSSAQAHAFFVPEDSGRGGEGGPGCSPLPNYFSSKSNTPFAASPRCSLAGEAKCLR